jgi:predicted Zn-dependent protease
MNPIFEKVAQYIKTHTQADDYVLNIRASDSHETRFAQNGITQHIAGPTLDIDLEVAFGNRTGSCSINQGDEDTLAYLVKTAEDIARLNRPDPEYMPSVGVQELTGAHNTDPETMALQPARMVEIVQQAIGKAKNIGSTVSGMTEKHIVDHFLATGNGFVGADSYTEFGHSMTLKKDKVETKVSYNAMDLAGFSLDREFERLATQAESLKNMQDFDPCKIAVILRPGALEELMWFMAWMMNRRQSDEGFTPYTDKLGMAFFGPNFTLKSTRKQPRLYAPPFDREGVSTLEIDWVKDGILQNLPTNRYWAREKNSAPLSMYNMFISGGDATEEEMMQLVPRGLIINRFWYIRTVDAKAGEFTGMTRDGVLYFEDGKVRNAVNNLRFNEIPHDAMRRILALGPNALSSRSAHIPTMLVNDFNFVDKTSF